jgi:ubiquinone/menaquinone biosynthesis C-methylase UbiE
VEEVAATAVVEVELVDAEAIHLPLARLDDALTLAAQHVEIPWRQDAAQDKEAVLAELARVLGRDGRNRDGHVVLRDR